MPNDTWRRTGGKRAGKSTAIHMRLAPRVGPKVGPNPRSIAKSLNYNILLGAVGGDGGIRTLDRALQPYNGLANRRLQPLGHVSGSRVPARRKAAANRVAQTYARPGTDWQAFRANATGLPGTIFILGQV